MRFRRMKERILSDRLPKHRDRVKMTVSELAESLAEFADIYLKAAMVLTVDNPPIGYLYISDEYAAYAVKLMVKHAPKDKMLRVLVTGDENGLVIEAEYPDGLPGLDNTAEIFAAARNAGFVADFKYNKIFLKAPLMDRKLVTLRSGSPRSFLAVLEEMFFD